MDWKSSEIISGVVAAVALGVWFLWGYSVSSARVYCRSDSDVRMVMYATGTQEKPSGYYRPKDDLITDAFIARGEVVYQKDEVAYTYGCETFDEMSLYKKFRRTVDPYGIGQKMAR